MSARLNYNLSMLLSQALLKIALPLGMGILALLIGTIFLLWYRYQRRHFFQRMRELLAPARLDKITQLLSKINATNFGVTSNHERISKLEMVYDQLDQALVKANGQLKLAQGRFFPLTRRGQRRLRHELEEQVAVVDFLDRKFSVISATLVTPDEQLRDQFARYQAVLRQGLEIYRYKQMLMEQIKHPLTARLEAITATEGAFNKALATGEMKTASAQLKVYGLQIEQFLHLLDVAPTLHSYIYQVIPDQINKLTNAYQARTTKQPSVYVVSDLAATLKLISHPYKELRQVFAQLDMARAKALMQKVLVALNALEQQVTFEAAAYELFLTHRPAVLSHAEQALARYDEFKLQLEILFGKGYVVPRELSEANHEAQRRAGRLRSDVAAFTAQTGADAGALLNSARLQRARDIAEQAHGLLQSLNQLNNLFWLINTEMIDLRRKHRRSEAAFSEVTANIKRYQLNLAAAELAQQAALRVGLNGLAQRLKVDFPNEALKQDVARMAMEVAAFYQAVGASVYIAEMASNLLRDFAPLRAVENKLDQDFSLAERFYMEGKYTEALTSIVQRLEERIH